MSYHTCQTCGGAGFLVTCIDDLCRGAGECMHGDGMGSCPDCDYGEVFVEDWDEPDEEERA